MSDPSPSLVVSHLNAAYEGSQVLRQVSLQVPPRQVVSLMGRNGVGKTTTLKCLVGLVKPTAGEIRLGTVSLTGLRPEERARLGLGYVPQGRDIFPSLTVWENLQIGLACQPTPAEGGLERVFELFPVLKDMLKRKGGVLSGGQQQQLAIARALLTEPKVLLLDEPTEGIQPNIIDQIGETLLQLKREGRMSMLLVEQYLDFCLNVADSFYVLDRGAVAAEGPINQLNEAVVKEYLTV